MSRFDPPLDLKDVSERNLSAAVYALGGYLKFTSMAWIRALRQPILDGLIIKRWSAHADEALRRFCRRHICDEVLVRIDMLNRRWSKRRGGYIIPASKARTIVRELNRDERIAALLEPLSPYRDRYCLAAITDEAQEGMTVEVVGPGFDASDLLRSDTLPHERFEVYVPLFSQPKRVPILKQRTYVVSVEDYKATTEARLVKIGAKLRNPAYPDLVPGFRSVQRMSLVQEAMEFLKHTKQTVLLEHLDAYEPIPRRFLERFANGVGNIIAGLRRYNIELGSTSFSGSFTTRGRFVFWDFFPADLSRAKMLSLRS
jgi:hypothetical protein